MDVIFYLMSEIAKTKTHVIKTSSVTVDPMIILVWSFRLCIVLVKGALKQTHFSDILGNFGIRKMVLHCSVRLGTLHHKQTFVTNQRFNITPPNPDNIIILLIVIMQFITTRNWKFILNSHLKAAIWVQSRRRITKPLAETQMRISFPASSFAG
jgi:hypothetical protein